MAGLVGLVLARITGSLKLAVTVYSLVGIGCLVAIFAAGYALDAGRAALAFRYGPVAASLAIAGGLLIAALLLGAAAWFLQRRPRTSDLRTELEKASPFSNPPYPAPYSLRRLAAVASAGAGAACGGLVVYLIRERRRAALDERRDEDR